MRIVQALAVLSPDNIYGGPATVAIDQCRALAAAGHEVVLLAGAIGYHSPHPTLLHGVNVRLFPIRRLVPGTGFAGIAAPGMNLWLARNLGLADVLHVHLARDLLTLPAAAQAQLQGASVFLQTHGMVDESSSPLAAGLDTVMTRRVLRKSRMTFVLTEAEGRDVGAVAPGTPTQVLLNGIVVDGPLPGRGRVASPLVLFLARLAPRKRPEAFVEAALKLLAEFPQARFRLVGPDEGSAGRVVSLIERHGVQDRIQWVGPASRDECAQHMREADLYVLPSVNEPFGMTVLEAMRAAIPAIVTDSCELGPVLEGSRSGLVSGASPEELAAAMREYLANPQRRLQDGRNAYDTVIRHFSMERVSSDLEAAYASSAAVTRG